MNGIAENETQILLYPGRARKPIDQAKYAAAMASKSGTAKTIYALLDWFGGWSLMAALAHGRNMNEIVNSIKAWFQRRSPGSRIAILSAVAEDRNLRLDTKSTALAATNSL
jgi:hypothetical protein